MASGSKTMVLNTRERAVSTDINRAQSFQAAMFADYLWQLYGVGEVSIDATPGVSSTPVPGVSPATATVVRGLITTPVNGTLDMTIEAGMILIDDGAAGTDDSRFRYVVSAAVPAGTISFTANGVMAVRIDVIECRPNPVVNVLETDNRDIYDPVTGLFTPTLVNKVTNSALEWRIRLGVAGAGHPGWAAGWVPMTVVHAHPLAATWDDCDLWDVRPLLSYRFRDNLVQRTVPLGMRSWTSCYYDQGLAAWKVDGPTEAEFLAGRAGGLMRNSPTDSLWINPDHADVSALGAPVGSLPWYVYICFPFSRYGWVRYCSSASSPRIPTGPIGIPVSTQIAPNQAGMPLLPITLPTSLGFAGATTSTAFCIGAGIYTAGVARRGWRSDGDWSMLREGLPSAATALFSDVPTGYGRAEFQLVDNITHPACAKALRCVLSVTQTFLGGARNTFQTTLYETDSVAMPATLITATLGAFTSSLLTTESSISTIDVPLHYTGGGATTRYLQARTTSGVNHTPSAASLTPIGWKLSR